MYFGCEFFYILARTTLPESPGSATACSLTNLPRIGKDNSRNNNKLTKANIGVSGLLSFYT
jgi:hypothetical protein